MATYHTVQREELLRFLKDHKTMGFTVKEIADALKADETVRKAPGESTVYRLMKELVESGEVKRTVKGSGRQFAYRITDGANCTHHLHMQCTSCGKLFHMDDGQSKAIIQMVTEHDLFEIDHSAVLPGTCVDCKVSKGSL